MKDSRIETTASAEVAPVLDYAPRRWGTEEEENYRHTLLGRFDEGVLSNIPARIALLVVFGAILIIPSVQFVIKIQETKATILRIDEERNRSALGRWIPSAELVWQSNEKEHPYGLGHWFPGAPIVLISVAVLSKLGYLGAGLAWAGLKISGFIIAMWLVVRSIGSKSFGVPVGVMLAAGIFSIRPVVSDLQHGNVNTFILIWLAIAWALFVRKQDLWAGVFIALAVVTKLTPALVLVYFAYKRQWRVCIGALVGLTLLFLVIPSIVLGVDRNIDYLQKWYEMLIQPFLQNGYATREIPNQSLWGVTLRLLGNAGILATEHMPDEAAFRTGMETMERPISLMGGLLRPAMNGTLLLCLAWICRRRLTSRRDARWLLELGLVLVAMLLLGERTWKQHATTLPLVFLGVWYVLTCVRFTDQFRALFVTGLCVQFVLLVASTEGLLGDELAELLLDGGVFCWGLLLCFVQTGILLYMLNRRTRDGNSADASCVAHAATYSARSKRH